MKFKKSQSSVEFILILLFVLIIIALVMSVISIYLLDLQKVDSEKKVDDFAENILVELDIMEDVEEGYYRRFDIPFYLSDRYDIQINHSYLILKDIVAYGNDTSNDLYYILPGSYNVSLEKDYFLNVTYIVFVKENNIDYENFINLD